MSEVADLVAALPEWPLPAIPIDSTGQSGTITLYTRPCLLVGWTGIQGATQGNVTYYNGDQNLNSRVAIEHSAASANMAGGPGFPGILVRTSLTVVFDNAPGAWVTWIVPL